jgi:hypothetical protein
VREVDVVGVRVEMPSNQPIVLLREVDGDRYLPIWIGAVEATAIAFAQQGVVPPRPLTHDLMRDLIRALDVELSEVRITEMREGVFYAGPVLGRRGQRPAVGLDRPGAANRLPDHLCRGRPRRRGRPGPRGGRGRGREVPGVPRQRLARGLREPLRHLTFNHNVKVATRRHQEVVVFDGAGTRPYGEVSSM